MADEQAGRQAITTSFLLWLEEVAIKRADMTGTLARVYKHAVYWQADSREELFTLIRQLADHAETAGQEYDAWSEALMKNWEAGIPPDQPDGVN